MKLASLLILCGVFAKFSHSARILCIFMTPSISHQIVFQPIWKELSLRGHKVTVLTPDPLRDPTLTNLTEIDLSFSYEIMRAANLQKSISKEFPVTDTVRTVYKIFHEIAEAQLGDESVQKLLGSDATFDVALVETILPTFFAFSSRFSCPLIGVSSLGINLVSHDFVANPSHPISHPDFRLTFPTPLNFYHRIYSVYYSLWYRFNYHTRVFPTADKMARKYIGGDLPYLGDIARNFSLLLLNVNPIQYSVRPNVPGVIELGLNPRKPKGELTKDLQKELDDATEGVIYFSLGSNVKSANLSTELRDTIIGALSELPYKVLWKWEADHLPNQPSNVIIRKWLPQPDVLAHRNVKAFVTQGGLQSMEEAITSKVPLIGMPFFGDQPMNVLKMVQLGIARSVDAETVTKETLKEAIIEVAQNPKYREKISEISTLITDQPMTGLEKAVWWTEYVIRHKGAPHLRSPALDLPIYQYFLLDIIGFVLLVLGIGLFVLYKALTIGFRFVFRSKQIKHKLN